MVSGWSARLVPGLGSSSWRATDGEETEGILIRGKYWWWGDEFGPMAWRIRCGTVWLDNAVFVARKRGASGERSYDDNW
jgi:hypothetical protein